MLYPISYYIALTIQIVQAALDEAGKGQVYAWERDNGLLGHALELALKDYLGKPLTLSPAGRCDVRLGTRNCEIKQGAGILGPVGGKLLKGSGLMLFVPVVLEDYDILHQQGYITERPEYLEAMDRAGALREKVTSKGLRVVTLQTFWNRSKNKPHGRLLSRMEEELEACPSYEDLTEVLLSLKK